MTAGAQRMGYMHMNMHMHVSCAHYVHDMCMHVHGACTRKIVYSKNGNFFDQNQWNLFFPAHVQDIHIS